MNEKAHRRLHIIFSIIIAALVTTLVIFLGPRRIPVSVSDRMERLQTQLRAAQDSASILVGQLGQLSIDSYELEIGLGNLSNELERSEGMVFELERQIENSRNSSQVIGESIIDIGEFINRIERNNSQGTTSGED